MKRAAAPALAALAALVLADGDAAAQDALRGKRLYLDVGRLSGAGVSCVDCHGGLPGAAFGIEKAANDARLVENAVATIPQMARLRGRLSGADFVDLAAFIGSPSVPSPDLRLTTAAAVNGADRVDFGPVAAGGAASAALYVVNVGQVAMSLAAAPRIEGADAGDFAIAGTDCAAGMPLAAQQSCRIDLVFQPTAAALRTSALRIDHDWVGGTAAVALIGNAGASAPPETAGPAGVQGGSGAGALGLPALVGLAALCAGAARRSRRRR